MTNPFDLRQHFARLTDEQRATLPLARSLVTIAAPGGAKVSVLVGSVSPRGIVTATKLPLRPGLFVDLSYAKGATTYRCNTRVLAVTPAQTLFALPAKVETTSGPAFAHDDVRVPVSLDVEWRYAAAGKGVGESKPGQVRVLGRGAAELVLDSQLSPETAIELRLALDPAQPPLRVVGTAAGRAMRTPPVDRYAHNVRFNAGQPALDSPLLTAFIARRLQELRG